MKPVHLRNSRVHILEVFLSNLKMVNTHKRKYQAHSSKAVVEVPDTWTNMHSVRMRGGRFKSTPSQRPYHLPSEKNKVNPFDSPNFSIHDENVTSSAAENAKNEQVVSESHMSEMDLDEWEDVPLARLLKNGLFSNAELIEADVPVTSFYFDNSSSSEDIFVPTPGQLSTINEDIGQSCHSPTVSSPVWTSLPVDVQQSVPDSLLDC